MTPIGALGRGVLAGGFGTVAMDLLWFYRYDQCPTLFVSAAQRGDSSRWKNASYRRLSTWAGADAFDQSSRPTENSQSINLKEALRYTGGTPRRAANSLGLFGLTQVTCERGDLRESPDGLYLSQR